MFVLQENKGVQQSIFVEQFRGTRTPEGKAYIFICRILSNTLQFYFI